MNVFVKNDHEVFSTNWSELLEIHHKLSVLTVWVQSTCTLIAEKDQQKCLPLVPHQEFKEWVLEVLQANKYWLPLFAQTPLDLDDNWDLKQSRNNKI